MQRTRTSHLALSSIPWLLAALLLMGPPLTAQDAPDPLAVAAAKLAAGDPTGALQELEAVFAAGYPTPSTVYTDPRFTALRETATARGPWRELMRRHVRESEIRITGDGEPGRTMLVRGRVLRVGDGRPVPGATVELYQTDDSGEYEPGGAIGRAASPRLFGFVRTDDAGEFRVRTIEPAAYPGYSGPTAHVHFRVAADGFRTEVDEFHPYDHPATEEGRHRARERGEPTSETDEEGELLITRVTIPLQPDDPSPGP